MTNNDAIRLLGRTIHGDNWQRPLARDLGCDERQVRRWARDEAEARHSAVMSVIVVAQKRHDELGAAIDRALKR